MSSRQKEDIILETKIYHYDMDGGKKYSSLIDMFDVPENAKRFSVSVDMDYGTITCMVFPIREKTDGR